MWQKANSGLYDDSHSVRGTSPSKDANFYWRTKPRQLARWISSSRGPFAGRRTSRAMAAGACVAGCLFSSVVLASPPHLDQPKVTSSQTLASGVKVVEWDLESLRSQLHKFQNAGRDVVQRLRAEVGRQVAIMERVIEKAGLDVDDLVAELRDQPLRQGGPFVALPAPNGDSPAAMPSDGGLNSSLLRWDLLRDIIETLPLSPPLDGYVTRSAFGKRRDPFNGRWAVHQGVDLDAPYKSPIVAAAPGTVVFAGWQRGYGRFVAVRHSPRVTTRYAHLAKILVKKGDVIDRGDRIGLLGSSGRATGAHLHYEVVFDGQHRDPMTFINAGQAALAEP